MSAQDNAKNPNKFSKKTVKDIDVAGKRVLVRVDYNVPTNAQGNITDDSRIRASLPTIKYLLDHKAHIILASHFGRPKGKAVDSMRLAPMAQRLSELINRPVKALKDCIGPEVESAVKAMKDGDIVMLENLRFHNEEEANDPAFAKAVASLAQVYVDDAFGAAHRAHASVSGVAAYLPAVGGFLMEKELNFLGKLLANPAHPFVGLLGGAKVSDKMGVIDNILDKVDAILIGGGMAANFLKAQGVKVGISAVEDDQQDYVKQVLSRAKTKGVLILLPTDVVASEKLEAGPSVKTVSVNAIPANCLIADIGPETSAAFVIEINKCKTAFWNGPMGVFEVPAFAGGTQTVARALAFSGATTVIGGGSTAESVAAMGLESKMTHVSTGGGASLEFLEGKVLPGVAALMDK